MIIYAAQPWLRVGRRYVLLLEGKAGVGGLPSPFLISSKGLVFVLPNREQVFKAGSFLGPGPLEELGMGRGLHIQPPEKKPEATGPPSVQERCRLDSGALLSPAWLGYGPSSQVPFLFVLLPVSLVNEAWLLIGGEKDVKLIPTLIKTVSRLNMYEHILIWGLSRKEN